MDDFNATVLSEAKNEYSSRLVNVLAPLIIQGFKAIFKEAWDLCIKNEEDAKYLMTFQNFLTRVPKWNQEIINVETKRILDSSKCLYLADLLTCVHITQLKILTSIRVSSKQKKIDIDIPKLHDYIHKVYISSARKLYQNVYLFEENILPLQKQKNMRECEIIIKESILNVIRESMPIEKILRAYIDETIEEEIVEETIVVPVENKVPDTTLPVEVANAVSGDVKATDKMMETDLHETIKDKTLDNEVAHVPTPDLVMAEDKNIAIPALVPPVESPPPKVVLSPKMDLSTIVNNKTVVSTPPASPSKITFNDKDNVVKYSAKDNPSKISAVAPEIISAPKTIERLERISTERNEQRKLEEDEEDEGDSIKILDTPIKLETLDIHDISTGLKLNTNPELVGVEVLA